MDGTHASVSIQEAIVYRDESITKRILFKEPQASSFVLNFKPGQAVPPHQHAGSLVILQPLAGTGRLTVEGDEQIIRPGDLVRVSGQATLSIACEGQEPLSVLVTLAPTPADERYTQPV